MPRDSVAGPGQHRHFQRVRRLDLSGPARQSRRPTQGIYTAYARRKPGVSVAQALADVKRAAAEIAAPIRRPVRLHRGSRVSPREHAHGPPIDAGPAVRAAGLLLLISCANVATLLLARSVARSRDTAIRGALGASRSHLALRYLVEGGMVALAGAAAGVALCVPLVRVILTVGSGTSP